MLSPSAIKQQTQAASRAVADDRSVCSWTSVPCSDQDQRQQRAACRDETAPHWSLEAASNLSASSVCPSLLNRVSVALSGCSMQPGLCTRIDVTDCRLSSREDVAFHQAQYNWPPKLCNWVAGPASQLCGWQCLCWSWDCRVWRRVWRPPMNAAV